MLRELIIRFNDDGEVYREIDESRNYFLSEAEKIVDNIRIRLLNEKRIASPKEFECWIDNTRLVITHVRFEKNESLEEQLTKTILGHNSWEEELRNKYVNKLKEYAERERELLAHKQFRAFAIRLDQYLGGEKVKPFPFLIGIENLKELFDGIYVHIATGFYSEIEEVMRSINNAYQTVIEIARQELLEEKAESQEGSFINDLKDQVNKWLDNKDNFNRFKQYTSSSYQSVAKVRINALYPNFDPYQKLLNTLFIDYVKKYNFSDAYRLNNQLLDAFYTKFDAILFEGFVLSSDEVVESLVLSPVIKQYNAILVKRMDEDVKSSEVEETKI